MASSRVAATSDAMGGYLDECRVLALDEISHQMTANVVSPYLSELILDYPLRGGKGLRPALAIAMCRALGGSLDAIVPTAAILELYHNAFLIHDDVEDESTSRRGRPTLHLDHGVPIAVNVGDAMLCLTLPTLIQNTERLGLGPALRILDVVADMTRHSVDGQATELRWIRDNSWSLSDDDYLDMVVEKTGWYSFISPLQIGAIAAGVDQDRVDALVQFGANVAISFQITDDVLNLDGALDGYGYGKEYAGDLWEGKRTLPLLHAFRSATADEQRLASAILARPRPNPSDGSVSRRIALLVGDGRLDDDVAAELLDEIHGTRTPKRPDDVEFLRDLIDRYGGIDQAMAVAHRHADHALEIFDSWDWIEPSQHTAVLRGIVEYVHRRRA